MTLYHDITDRWRSWRIQRVNRNRAFFGSISSGAISGWSSTPCVFLVSMIRNEADILGHFIAHCAEIFDHLVLIDHMSVDNSTEIMREAEQSGLSISRFVFPYRGYYQAEVSTAAARWAFSRGADWVFFLDADEFLDVANRPALDHRLKNIQSGLASFVWKNCIPVEYGAFETFNFETGFWKPKKLSCFSKIAVRRDLAAQFADLEIQQGNHRASASGRFLDSEFAGEILHFPIRSLNRLKLKLSAGTASYHSKHSRHEHQGFHWFELHEKLADGALDATQINWIVAHYSEPFDKVQSLDPAGDSDWELQLAPPPMRQVKFRSKSICFSDVEIRESAVGWQETPRNLDDAVAFMLDSSSRIKWLPSSKIKLKLILKRVLGWDQRTEAEKAAVRRFLFINRQLIRYLGPHVIPFFPPPLWVKRNLRRALWKGPREISVRGRTRPGFRGLFGHFLGRQWHRLERMARGRGRPLR